MHLLAFCVAVIAIAFAPLDAHAGAIDAKPGLWEYTTVMRQEGMPPMPDLSKLPPEQRARMQPMIDEMSGKPVTRRRCMTAESMQSWEKYASQAQEESSCRYTVQEASPKRGRMAMSCEGGKTTGTMDWSAPTPERMEGRVEMTSRRGAAETRMTATTTGRWLAAECGDVSTD